MLGERIMKQIVLMSARPWRHIKYLEKLCENEDVELEAILFEKSQHYSKEFQDYHYNLELIPKLEKNFSKINCMYAEKNEVKKQANYYLNKGALIIAEFEFVDDSCFEFIAENPDAINIIPMSMYEYPIGKFHQKFGREKYLFVPRYVVDSQIVASPKLCLKLGLPQDEKKHHEVFF